MPYLYKDDIAIADIAFEAWGDTLEDMIKSASDALLGIMVENPESIEAETSREVKIEASSPDMLLFRLLNEIVYLKDAQCSFFRVSEAVVNEKDGELVLDAVLTGEPIDISKHNTMTDIKAVTMHMFSVEKTDNCWRAVVVADI